MTIRSPCVGVRTRLEEPLEDGGLGLLDLEEERIVVAGSLEQRHERRQPDAADADDLERRVDDPVAIEQDATVLLEALPVAAAARVVGEPERQLRGWMITGGRSTIRRCPSGDRR